MKLHNSFSPKIVLYTFLCIVCAFSVFAAYANCPGDTTNGKWEITTTHTVNTTENIVCAYINITSTGKLYVNSSVGNFTVNITVENLTIRVGGEINGTGTGYINGSGEGQGAGKSADAGGGASHGGQGGNGQFAATSGKAGNFYGYALEPRTLGSPGGCGGTNLGASGGGAVIINVSDTFWLNGTLAVNGEPNKWGTGNGGGGGSGGSIFIDTVNLFGNGSIQAKGGQGRDATNDAGSGGGGRIAVYYNATNSDFWFNRTTVDGAPALGSGNKGESGTAMFLHKPTDNLYIVGGFDFTLPTYNYSNVTVEHALLRANNSFEFNATSFANTGNNRFTNITCYNWSRDFTLRILDQYGFDNVNVSDKGIYYSECGNITILRTRTRTNLTINNFYLWSNTSIIFNVTADDLVLNLTLMKGNVNFTEFANLSVYSSSEINATALGNKNTTGEGAGGTSTTNGGGGAGYGGRGGAGGGGKGGNHYGNPLAPNLFGSGGGGTNNQGGGAGGGLIYINVSNTLWLNGTIVANGEIMSGSGISNGAGGGSGGSIWVDVINFYGTGKFLAQGGQGVDATNDGGMGGGGRIAVYYNTTNSEVWFNRTKVESMYSSGNGARGDPGTAVFIDKDDKYLYIIEGFEFTLPTYNYSNVTVEHALLRANQTFEFNATSFVNTGNNRITNMTCYNTSHDFTFKILQNLGLENFNLSDRGVFFMECGNITFHRTEIRTNFTTLLTTIESNKTLNFNVTDDDLTLVQTILYGNMNFTLKNMTINGTSALIANFRGAWNGTGNGTGVSKAGAGGAGYGGTGGNGSTAGATGGLTYGSSTTPADWGSGGAGSTTASILGGNGGGAIFINASNRLEVNGTINASGQTGAGTGSSTAVAGAGSGGSIWIWTKIFNGTGKIVAMGGYGAGGISGLGGGGGGGGRIAVYYHSNQTTSLLSSALGGGQGGNARVGLAGTELWSLANILPTVDVPVFNVTTVTKASGVKVNTTYNDGDSDTATLYFRWFRNGTEILSDNYTNIPANTIVNSTLSNTLYIRGDILNATVYANDGINNSAVNESVQKTVANSVPAITAPSFNVTTVTETSGAGISSTYSDADTDGGTAYFRWFRNGSEVKSENISSVASGNSAASTLSNTLYIRGDILNATVYANDSTANSALAESAQKTVANTVPTVDVPVFNVTNITPSSGVKANTTYKDSDGDGGTLYFRWFRNGTEIFTNNQSAIAVNAIVTSTLSSSFLNAGDSLNVTVYANDGSDNSAEQKSITDTVWSDIVFSVQLLTPENGSRRNNLNQEFNFNVTGTTVAICSLYNNASGTFSNISSISTITQYANSSITHNSIPENNTIVWNIVCISTGGVEFRAINNFSLGVDRTMPLLTFASPVRTNSSSFIASTVNVNVSCSDTGGIFEFLANITNATGQSIYENLTTSITGTAFELAPAVNFANNASGTYRINVQCSDDHTRREIKEYGYTRRLSESIAEFETSENTNVTIEAVFSNLVLDDILVERSDANDRYHFIFDWRHKAPRGYTFIYHIDSTQPVYYRNNSNYTAHFVTSENWIDFEGLDGAFTVFENATGWYVQIVTNETYHNFSSIGGLNIVEENVSFMYDLGFDIANTTVITANPTVIRQNNVVNFNATFNVTGVSNASGVNVTLTVDNAYIAGTSVALVSGTTRQVELNWTAVPGVHTIRINADANNTFAEAFEGNNNATVSITAYNISVLNLSSPATNTEIIRGKDTSSLPGEDTLKKVNNLTTILARVYNKNAVTVGVNSNCTYYLNTTYLGFNTTNTTGECSLTFDHTAYNASVYNITVNFTNLNTTDYLPDTSSVLIQNNTIIDLSKVEIDLDADNLRAGSVYNPGDVAVMNITVTKNSTAFDPSKFTVEVKDPGTECNSAGGILYNHSYPGDVVRISAGLYQSYSVLIGDTDIHWCVVVNNSASSPLASASHSDKEVTNTGANRANLTIVNTTSAGDDAVFDDINISFKTANNHTIFDTNFTATGAENRLITLNDKYNVVFRYPATQEQLSITGLNITTANASLPFNLLTSYSGNKPVNFTNTTAIIAFNNSGFRLSSATITLQKSGLTVNKILHCLNWNFSSGNCIGLWEINTTADYAGFNQNATHFWFNVNAFTAYAGGNGTNSQLQIYDTAENTYAEAASFINFTANYTRVADNASITSASCTFNTSTTLYDMTYDSTKQVYNYTANLTAANYSWTVACSKGSSFDQLNATDTVEVRDTVAPTVGRITPIVVTTDLNTTYSANVTDAGGLASCYFFKDGTNSGLMSYNGTAATITAILTSTSTTIYEVYANCTDNQGNIAYNATNVTVSIIPPPRGNAQEGSSKAADSTAATAGGFEGGTKYMGLEAGNVVSLSPASIKIITVYPSSVRLDINGLYNIILLEGLFRKLDVNQNGIPETTVYIDRVVAYSKVDLTVLVEDDGSTVHKGVAQDSLSLFSTIWNKVANAVKQKEEVEEPTGEQPREEPQQQAEAAHSFVQETKESMHAVGGKLKSWINIFSSGDVTGAVVYEETTQFIKQDVLSSDQMKIAAMVTITMIVILPLITSSYAWRRMCRRRADKIAAALKKEMKYRGLR